MAHYTPRELNTGPEMSRFTTWDDNAHGGTSLTAGPTDNVFNLLNQVGDMGSTIMGKVVGTGEELVIAHWDMAYSYWVLETKFSHLSNQT